MRNMNEIFGKIAFCDITTKKDLRKNSECVKEYKGYSIAFGKPQRDEKGTAWWTVRVYQNEDQDRIGAFSMRCLCRTDTEAMHQAYIWAKQNIDEMA